jgi:hypothetical protein
MMTLTQSCILAWAILGLVVVAILLRFGGRRANAEERFLIDVALVALIVIIWVRWQRNGPSSHNGEA